jgi:hypothetical protein
VGGRGPAGGHYFSTPSAERVRDVLSPEAESFPDRGVCWGLDRRGGRLLGCMWVKKSQFFKFFGVQCTEGVVNCGSLLY